MNEVKIKEEVEIQSDLIEQSADAKKKAKKSGKETSYFFNREDASKWLPFTFFTFVIIVLYISIQQYAERTVRNTEKLTREIKELRSEYLSTKAELMKQSMQTDIAKKLEAGGLKELRTPAMKLKLEADKSK